MKRPEPQQTLGLRLVEKKGLDAYNKGEDLADFNASARLKVINSVEISAQRGALQRYKEFLSRQ